MVGRDGDDKPLACVLGGMDLVAPLARAGIRSAVVVTGTNAARWSRHVVAVIDRPDPWADEARYVERVLEWGSTQPDRPVLYYCTDATQLIASRHRDALGSAFRIVQPDAEVVEDLADKARFTSLAKRLDLPVPRAVILPGGDPATLRFPVIVKPTSQRGRALLHLAGKAVRVDSSTELDALWRRIEPTGVAVLVQEMIPGPETRIESYHAYVDSAGVVGEFTGEKVRTHPEEFGETVQLRITNRGDVREIGRHVVHATRLRGVCKVDLKRDPDGRLWVLEVNARFNLWHNAGAKAGVNLPALVYADLTGTSRPPIYPVREGVTWIEPAEMWRAGTPRFRWLLAVLSSDTRGTGEWSDPLPLVRGVLVPSARRRLSRRLP